MKNETKYMVKWRTNREHEKNKVFSWAYNTLKEAIQSKKEKETIKENIEIKIFEVKIEEIRL